MYWDKDIDEGILEVVAALSTINLILCRISSLLEFPWVNLLLLFELFSILDKVSIEKLVFPSILEGEIDRTESKSELVVFETSD